MTDDEFRELVRKYGAARQRSSAEGGPPNRILEMIAERERCVAEYAEKREKLEDANARIAALETVLSHVISLSIGIGYTTSDEERSKLHDELAAILDQLGLLLAGSIVIRKPVPEAALAGGKGTEHGGKAHDYGGYKPRETDNE